MTDISLLIIILLLLSLFSSPMEQTLPDNVQQLTGGINKAGFYKIIDEEAGVVCWIATGRMAVGIDCIPLTELE